MRKSTMLCAALLITTNIGCAYPLPCYRIHSTDTWITARTDSHNGRSRSRDFFGDVVDRTSSDGRSVGGEVGVNFHWANSCEWEYVKETSPKDRSSPNSPRN